MYSVYRLTVHESFPSTRRCSRPSTWQSLWIRGPPCLTASRICNPNRINLDEYIRLADFYDTTHADTPKQGYETNFVYRKLVDGGLPTTLWKCTMLHWWYANWYVYILTQLEPYKSTYIWINAYRTFSQHLATTLYVYYIWSKIIHIVRTTNTYYATLILWIRCQFRPICRTYARATQTTMNERPKNANDSINVFQIGILKAKWLRLNSNVALVLPSEKLMITKTCKIIHKHSKWWFRIKRGTSRNHITDYLRFSLVRPSYTMIILIWIRLWYA